jgi:hypothetical protein
MQSKTILLAVLVFALACVQARADFAQYGTFSVIDGQGPNGTYQTWDAFNGPDNLFTDPTPFVNDPLLDIPADVATLDSPTADVYAEHGVGDTGPIQGVYLYPIGQLYASPQMRIELDIPNLINPNLTKIVQATLTYQTQRLVGSGFVDAWLVPIANSANHFNQSIQYDPVAGVESTANNWTTLKLEWQYPQLYPAEEITILLHDSGVTLDRVTVETQCVPLPGAVLLGMLGLAAAGRKLRQMC